MTQCFTYPQVASHFNKPCYKYNNIYVLLSQITYTCNIIQKPRNHKWESSFAIVIENQPSIEIKHSYESHIEKRAIF